MDGPVAAQLAGLAEGRRRGDQWRHPPPVLARRHRAGQRDGDRGPQRKASEPRSYASSKARMSRPVAGFGTNNVDLRGIRSPAAATAATSATGVGLSNSAVPPDARAASIAAGTSWR